MGFSLQAVGSDDYLSYSHAAMTALRAVLAETADSGGDSLVGLLAFSDGALVPPQDCRWIAEHLRRADRGGILRSDCAPEELLALIDELAEFCERCAQRRGFEVW